MYINDYKPGHSFEEYLARGGHDIDSDYSQGSYSSCSSDTDEGELCTTSKKRK